MDSPRVLLFDIETRPNLSYIWGRFEQNAIDVEKDWSILTFACKWLGEDKVYAFALPDFSLYKKDPENDREIVKKLWEFLNEADIVIAHNGNDFDIKKAAARFLVHGLPPPKPFKSIDTKLEVKKRFKFDSNKLDELGRQLGLGRKIQTGGFELWKGCMAGDEKAWKTMVKYNKQDVILLEKVFMKIRPWMSTYPIVRPDNGECARCGGVKYQKRGFSYTSTHRKQRFQCMDCMAWRFGKNEPTNP